MEHKQSGTILLAVIMLLLLIPVTVMLVYDTTAAKSVAIDRHIIDTQLNAVVNAAIAHARYQADANTSCAGFSDLPATTFGHHSYQVNIVQDTSRPSLLHLTAHAQLDSGAEITRTLTHVAYQPVVIGERRPEFDLTAHSANPDQSFQANDALTIGNYSIDKSYALLKFELSSVIPPDARIHSAVLDTTVKSVALTGDVSNTEWLSAHVITRRWTEAATWNSHDSNKSWRPNDVGEPVYATTPLDKFSGEPVISIDFDLTRMLRYWLSSHTTFSGVLLRSTNVGSLVEIYSLEHSDYKAQPHLNIAYSCPCGVTCGIQKRRNYLDTINAGIDTDTMLRTCEARDDYRGSDGHIRWTFQPWTEIGDDGNPCTGSVSLDQDPTLDEPDNWQIKLSGDGENIQRSVWLEQAEQVVISFRYRRDGLTNSNQTTKLRVFNAGDSATLLTINGGTSDSEYQTASVVVPSELVSKNTRLVFETSNYTATQSIYIDDIKLSFEGPVNPQFGLSITADTMINKDKGSDTYSNTTPLKLKDSTTKQIRILYNIDTDGLRPEDVVTQAALRAWISDNRTDRDATLSLFALTESWHENQATWNDREKSVTPWSTGGGTYFIPVDPADTPSLILAQGTKNVWIEFDITTLVQSWVEFPASNHGLLLIMEDGNRGKDLKIDSLEDADIEFHPHVDLQL